MKNTTEIEKCLSILFNQRNFVIFDLHLDLEIKYWVPSHLMNIQMENYCTKSFILFFCHNIIYNGTPTHYTHVTELNDVCFSVRGRIIIICKECRMYFVATHHCKTVQIASKRKLWLFTTKEIICSSSYVFIIRPITMVRRKSV